MANPTIGYITCPFTGEKNCEVRRDKKRKLYYYGSAGLVKPNLPAGQEYMQKHTRFIGENDKPLPPVNVVTEPKPKKSLLDAFFSDDE
jgi:hypothetical protein